MEAEKEKTDTIRKVNGERERERERAKREDCKISFTDSFTVAPKSPKLGIAEDGSTFLTLCSF